MRVLVACEESQTVANAFRAFGHRAYSCDVQPCSGGHPEWHIQGDVIPLLGDGWDLLIAHPPCTYLCNSGVRWLKTEPSRWEKLDEAAAFFRALWEADIPKIAVENPIPHKYAVERIGGEKYAQIIQPYQFGHSEKKATCLWLKNLPPLQPTNVLPLPASGVWDNQTKSGQNKLPPSEDRAKLRSKTYGGIAYAMAKQWGK